MSESKPTLFLVGTGFIGGTLLTSLLEQDKYEISALSRSEDKANKLKELGVRPVMGSLDDEALVEESAKADVSEIYTETPPLRRNETRLASSTLTLTMSLHRSSFTLRLPTTNLQSNRSSRVSLNVPLRKIQRFTFTLPEVRSSPFLPSLPRLEHHTDVSRSLVIAGILTVPLHPESIYFSDERPEQFDNLVPDHAPHRDVDLLIKEAVEKKQLNARVSIMLRKFLPSNHLASFFLRDRELIVFVNWKNVDSS